MLSKGAPKTGLLFAREHLSEYNGFQKNISAANKNCSIWSLQSAQNSNVCWWPNTANIASFLFDLSEKELMVQLQRIISLIIINYEV